MGFVEAIKTVLKKYCCFSGRARRSEYWWWTLAYSIISNLAVIPAYVAMTSATMAAMNDPAAAAEVAGSITSAYIPVSIVCLALFLPSLGVLVRRLHDTGRSGWCCLISLVPFIGAIILLIWLLKDSDAGSNKYGPNPKEAPAAE